MYRLVVATEFSVTFSLSAAAANTQIFSSVRESR